MSETTSSRIPSPGGESETAPSVPIPVVVRSSVSTVASLFLQQAALYGDRIALEDAEKRFSYAELADRSACLAGWLHAQGVARGDRVAILSENRTEYLEAMLACARIGAILACQNWRLAAGELAHCLSLVEPKIVLTSPRHADRLADLPSVVVAETLTFGADYENVATTEAPADITLLEAVEDEDPLLILYTSGTTGLPKGAVLSHRAEIVRNMVTRAEFGVDTQDTFAAWSPLYHMGAMENSMGSLMAGGKVIIVDGFDQQRLAEVVRDNALGWLLLMPGMVGSFAAELKQRGITAKSVKVCGVMADLVPPAEIAEITELLGAPYANTFGATETGCPPCSSSLIPIGVAPQSLTKKQSPFCEVKLVDAEDNPVALGKPGELCMRGPTLFSGYWKAVSVNAEDFRGGWFHMGDVFVRHADGGLDFVDRVKYLIKSGGENIYPAEIERVLLADPRVADAAVVRRADPKWGEVPVAFVARREGESEETKGSLSADDLYAKCRSELAGYKQPKDIRFIAMEDFPRSASGKIQRHELEKLL